MAWTRPATFAPTTTRSSPKQAALYAQNLRPAMRPRFGGRDFHHSLFSLR